ncbi:hypothetical protein BDZ88DRAFT_469216 [Geranomyces variabilis]|nr:hypothetical protein BDZ88DRAFT_469216 [Geranomyces variabilis]KAJ3131294.1 hypothetical protein HDU90_008606 [Geranomyces variabilis]
MSSYYDDETFEEPPVPDLSTAAATAPVAASESTHIRQTRLPRPAGTTNTKHVRTQHHRKHKQNHVPPSPSSTLRIYGPEGSEDDVAHSGAATGDAIRKARKKSVCKEPAGFVPHLPAAKIYSPNKKPKAATLVAPAVASHRAPGMGGQKPKQKRPAPPPPAALPPPPVPKRALSTVVNPAQLTNANFEEIAKLVAVIDAQKERIRGLTDANKTMKIVKQRQDKALQQMGKQQATFPNLVKQLTDEIRTLKYDRQRTREALTEKFHESLQKHAENVKLRLALVEARKADLELRMSQQRSAEAKGVPVGRGRGRGDQPRGAEHPAHARVGRGGGRVAAKVNKSTDGVGKHSVGPAVQVSLPAARLVHEKKELSRACPHPAPQRQTMVAASQSSSAPPRDPPHRGADSRAELHNDERDESVSSESDDDKAPNDRAPAAALPATSPAVSDTASTAAEPAYGSDFESDGPDDNDVDRVPEQSADDIVDETPTPVVDENTDADNDDDAAYASDFEPAETPTAEVVDSADEIGNEYDNDEFDMAAFAPTAADRAYLSQLGVDVPSPVPPPPPPVHNDPTPVALSERKNATLSANADSAAPSTIHKPNLFARPAPELSVSPPLQRQQPQQGKSELPSLNATVADQAPPRAQQQERQQQLPTQHKLDFLSSSTFGPAAVGAGTGSVATAYPSWLRGPAEAASS